MDDPRARIGFMQGRLCPPVEGKIQAFPWRDWREEFPRAEAAGFPFVEWTLDHDRLARNPLMTPDGRREIAALVARHRVRVASVTGDCFMQAPFWKESGAARAALIEEMLAVCAAGAALGARIVVVPLVDNGGLANRAQEDGLVATLLELAPRLTATLAFESDYAPAELARFIARLPASRFGVNYDIGNSASLGYAPAAEIAAYGGRIVNVHVKDRKRGGTTVPLGTGDADLVDAISRIERLGYGGGYVLQTARASDGDDVGAAVRYRDMTAGWIAGARRAA